jgi:hypothetical protein
MQAPSAAASPVDKLLEGFWEVCAAAAAAGALAPLKWACSSKCQQQISHNPSNIS